MPEIQFLEILPIEMWGRPLAVLGLPADADGVVTLDVHADPADVPQEAYERVGLARPESGVEADHSQATLSAEEAERAATPLSVQVRKAVASGEWDRVLEVSAGMDRELVGAKDPYGVEIAGLLSWIARRYGEAAGEEALAETAEVDEALPRRCPHLDITESVPAWAVAWRSHGSTFWIEEHDEYVLFRGRPLGACARMWASAYQPEVERISESRVRYPTFGSFQAPASFHKMREPRGITHGKVGYPIYSCHCHMLHEIHPIDQIGRPLWVENHPLDDPDGETVHVHWKDPNAWPEHYYEQVGRRKPATVGSGMSSESVRQPIIGPEGEPRLDPVPGVEGKFNGVMAWRPELMEAFFAFYANLWTDGVLDMRVKDLARMKIARTVGCRICQNTRFKVAEGHTAEADYADIDHVDESSYTDAERAALTYVEAFCVNASMVTDAIVEELRRHFSEAEIIELSILTATVSGFAKINVALNIAPDDEELQVFDFAKPVAGRGRGCGRPARASCARGRLRAVGRRARRGSLRRALRAGRRAGRLRARGGGAVDLVAGPDELREVAKPLSSYSTTFHLMANHTCEIEGALATGEVYCLAHHLTEEGAAGDNTLMVIRCRDRYAKLELLMPARRDVMR